MSYSLSTRLLGAGNMTIFRLQWKIIAWISAFAVPYQSDSHASVGKAAISQSHEAQEMKAVRGMDSAIKLLRSGQFTAADSQLSSVYSLLSDSGFRAVWYAVSSELKESLGQWIEAAVLADKAIKENFVAQTTSNSKRSTQTSWNPAVRTLLHRSIRNFLLAGMTGEAFAQFSKFKSELSSELLSSTESALMKRLADELRRIDRTADATAVEHVVFKFYPFIPSIIMESISPETVCRLDEEMQKITDKRSRGSLFIQRFGTQPDLMDYVLSFAGIPALQALVSNSVEGIPAENFEQILDVVEWLQSIRDYQTAIDMTSKLMLSQSIPTSTFRERLMMLHARNLNGVHRPEEAAALYRKLILQASQNESKKTARSRYVLSLHYAGQYQEAAQQSSLLVGTMRPRDVKWRVFWARYLSKQYSLAISGTSQEIRDDHRARIQYWKGRAYALEGQKREADEIMTRISHIDNASYYALFAQWRQRPQLAKLVSVQNPQMAFAAKNLNVEASPESHMLRERPKFSAQYQTTALLADAGYSEFLTGPLKRKLKTLSASGDVLADFLVSLGDGHASVQFATNQRKNLPKLPLGRENEWKAFLAKNESSLRLLYPLPYRDTVADAAESFLVSPWLVYSIMRAESLFQPQIVSSVGARGLMQIMPTTGERIAALMDYPDFEPSQLDQPTVNIAFGSWYLARLLDYYRGQLPLAIAAYNAGPQAIDRWLKRTGTLSLDEFLENIPFEQTRKYVSTVLTHMEIYSRLATVGRKGVYVDLSLPLASPRNDMEIF